MIGILWGVILICIGAVLERLKWPTFPAFLVGVLLGMFTWVMFEVFG